MLEKLLFVLILPGILAGGLILFAKSRVGQFAGAHEAESTTLRGAFHHAGAYRQDYQQSDSTPALWPQQFTKPSREALRAQLAPLSFRVTQENQTEPAYTSKYNKPGPAGIYVDVVSGEPLFSSTHQFDSGTGWPSFYRPIAEDAVTYHTDYTLIWPRTEVRSSRADSHLGHVFADGPAAYGGQRYCINGAAFRFIPQHALDANGYGEYLYLFKDDGTSS